MLQTASTTTLAVREMTLGDIPTVAALAAKIWHEHYPAIVSRAQIDYMLGKMCSEDALAHQLKSGQRFFVLEDNGVLTGYASLETKKPGEWYLDKLYVDVVHHRKGFGAILLAHIKHVLTPTTLTLRVNRANIKAINFYMRQGFYITGLHVLELEHGYVMDDFLMRWDAQ